MAKPHNDTSDIQNGIDGNQPKRSLEELKADAKHQLKKILTQGKNIKDFQSNIDLLIRCHHSHDSFLDNFAKSYSNLSWWIKLGMLASTVSLAACIGIACNFVITLTLVTFVLYSVLALILADHHAALLKKDTHIAVHINELEASLAESVQHINEIEESLQAIFTSLCEMNLQQAEDIESFEAQIATLEEQIRKLMEINEHLESSKDVLASSTLQMSEAFTKAKLSLKKLVDSLSNNAAQLSDTEQVLLQDTAKLLVNQQQLQGLSDSFGVNQATLSNMTDNIGEILDILKIQAAATEAFNEEALEKLSVEVNKTLKISIDTEKIALDADEIIEDSLTCLDAYQREKNKTNAQSAQKHTDIKQGTKYANAALERAANILSGMRNTQTSSLLSVYAPLMQ